VSNVTTLLTRQKSSGAHKARLIPGRCGRVGAANTTDNRSKSRTASPKSGALRARWPRSGGTRKRWGYANCERVWRFANLARRSNHGGHGEDRGHRERLGPFHLVKHCLTGRSFPLRSSTTPWNATQTADHSSRFRDPLLCKRKLPETVRTRRGLLPVARGRRVARARTIVLGTAHRRSTGGRRVPKTNKSSIQFEPQRTRRNEVKQFLCVFCAPCGSHLTEPSQREIQWARPKPTEAVPKAIVRARGAWSSDMSRSHRRSECIGEARSDGGFLVVHGFNQSHSAPTFQD
jgi:hypothetical protein